MRLVKLAYVPAFLLSALVILIGCGGGKEDATPAPSPTVSSTTSAPTPTIAPQPTSTSPAGNPSAGSVLERATIPPIEIENVRYGGTFKEVLTSMVAQLDPKIVGDVSAEWGSNWWYERLVAWEANPDNMFEHLVPSIAEKWEISSDVKTYTFHLRKGVKWQNIAPANGRELVANDVLVSLNRYKETDAVQQPRYQQVQSIEATDASTIVIRLKEPSAFALNDLAGRGEVIMPSELLTVPDWQTMAIGTGPYILQKRQLRVGSTSVRNPDYWKKDAKGRILPYMDRIEGVYITDKGTISAAFRAGQVDTGVSGPSDVLNVSRSIPDTRVFITGQTGAGGGAQAGIAFNTKNAPWSDVRVRRAISMLINHEEFAKTVVTAPRWYYGFPLPWTLVSDTPFKPEDMGPYYKFNPEESKKLLMDAGFPQGKMTIKTPFKFTADRAPLAQVLQQQLKQNGVDIPLQSEDNSTHFSAYYVRAHQDLTPTYQVRVDFSLNWYAENKYSPQSTQNTSFIDDPEVNKAIKEIKVTLDKARSQQLAKILWNYDTQNVYNIWLPLIDNFAAYSPRVRNLATRWSNGGRPLPWLTDGPRTTP
ncbi:MAG: ABC transporter substrate-binding protein [Dehalococcoidia bacterium]|nr:ABC transporter substrate-binding protein [Dehalococcoidia bacterium]